MSRPPRVAKVDDLSTESPTPRADAREARAEGALSFGLRFRDHRIQVRLVGASRSSVSHVVFMLGAMVPPAVALLICLAAGAATATTLLVCLPTMLLSGLVTVYRQRRR
jgi:hypothetical protein